MVAALAPLLACSSCFLGEADPRAYSAATVVMLLPPIFAVVAVGWWLRRSGAFEARPRPHQGD